MMPASDCTVRLLAVGTAHPPCAYTQAEMMERLQVTHPVVKRVFSTPHIQQRYLYLPASDPATGAMPAESVPQLQKKQRRGTLETGCGAITQCLSRVGLRPADIDYLVCVTSTGFMVPGLSALYLREFGFRKDCQRLDVVGMGCNAGLNGLNAAANWARVHPGQAALLVCCEINSAIYCVDDSVGTGIVNSLFGDGAAALLVQAVDRQAAGTHEQLPCLIGFESHMIPDQFDAMRFDWNEQQHRWSFYLSKEIPYVLGEHVKTPVLRLLKRHGLSNLHEISHWIIHTGGGAVIDAVKMALGLTEKDVRHSREVLRTYGNLASGSFLFSYERLVGEGVVQPGDYGMMITMGPGAQIETALLQW